MEFLFPDFSQGHSQTPSHHLCSPPFYYLLLSSISTLLWPQSFLTGPYSSPSPPPSSGGISQLLSTPP